jgi:hypothetical protein
MKRVARTLTMIGLLTPAISNGQEKTQDFYAIDTLQDIHITFEQSNWRYLLDSLRYNGEDMLLADLEINGVKLADVGVRYRDRRAFQPGQSRNSLFIHLDFIKSDQEYQGQRSVNLSSSLRDPSMLREVLGYEIARAYMPAPRANFAKVTINGVYYGLFVNVEPIDKQFLENNFQYSAGALFYADPNREEKEALGCKSDVDGSLQHDLKARCYLRNFQMMSEKGWDQLIELTRILDESPDRVAEVLDVDKTLWMLAFNNLTGNLRSYSGLYSSNYYLYRDRHGKFVPILYDLNLAFGSQKNTGVGSDLRPKAMEGLDPLLHLSNSAKPLIHKLLSNDVNRKIYLSHLRLMLNEHFLNARFEERAKTLQKLIKPAFEADQNRQYSVENFNVSLDETIGERSQIPGVVSYMKKRADFLRRHATLTIIPPEITNVFAARRKQFFSERIVDFRIQAQVEKMPRRVTLYYRFDSNEPYRETAMHDDGRHADEAANDGIYGAIVNPEGKVANMEYFIMAESAGAVSFDPPRYMRQPHRADLDELNK